MKCMLGAVREPIINILENSVHYSEEAQTSTRVSITVWKHGKCFLFLK